MDINPNPVIQNLLEDLKNGTDIKRCVAAYKLGKLGNPFAIPGLTEALQDPDASVRQNAKTAIREIESRKTLSENTTATPPSTIGERILAVLSHLLFLFLILTPLLDYLDRALAEIFAYIMLFSPPLYGLIIAIALRRRSPFTASHALQAALAHPIFPIIALFFSYLTNSDNNPDNGTLLAMCLLPIYSLWPLLILTGAAQAAFGKEFTYPLIGKGIKEMLSK